jgi:hypothetical protein
LDYNNNPKLKNKVDKGRERRRLEREREEGRREATERNIKMQTDRVQVKQCI